MGYTQREDPSKDVSIRLYIIKETAEAYTCSEDNPAYEDFYDEVILPKSQIANLEDVNAEFTNHHGEVCIADFQIPEWLAMDRELI